MRSRANDRTTITFDERTIDDELRSLTLTYQLDQLGRSLEHGALAVRTTRYQRGGQRLTLHLDDGTALVLRLYRSRRTPIAALLSLHGDERVGWVAVARSTTGDELTLYAWLATLSSEEPVR
jgi:hypothetical protein